MLLQFPSPLSLPSCLVTFPVTSQIKIFSPILVQTCRQLSHLKNKNVSLGRLTASRSPHCSPRLSRRAPPKLRTTRCLRFLLSPIPSLFDPPASVSDRLASRRVANALCLSLRGPSLCQTAVAISSTHCFQTICNPHSFFSPWYEDLKTCRKVD